MESQVHCMTIIIMIKKAEREAAFQDIVTDITNAIDANDRQEATRLLLEVKMN